MSTQAITQPENSIQETGISDPTPWLEPHRFKPGVSGNPSGRPKKVITEKLIERLTKQRLAEVVDAQIDAAIKGRTDAFCAIRDTVEGKPTQTVEQHGENRMEIVIVNLGAK